ncbi:MAG: hypothetical protein M3388_03110 [Acidobacteriota bacterium]|nr:hypothetical protein [Acidobacteriota bacterium]
MINSDEKRRVMKSAEPLQKSGRLYSVRQNGLESSADGGKPNAVNLRGKNKRRHRFEI